MAPFMGSQSLHRGRFICKACLSRSRRPGTPSIASRFRQNASFLNRASATPLTQTHSIRGAQSAAPRFSARAIDISPSHRLYSTETPPSEPANSGLAPLPSRRLISLSGPDTAKFLQGLITNNVDLERRSPFYAAFLDARGRVLWDVFVWVYPELVAREGGWACYIEVDGGEVEAMVKHLTRHKLRSKIKIAVVEENEMSVWAAWGVQLEQLHSEQLIASIPDPRGFASTDFGTRCLFRGNQAPANASAPVVDTRQYHLRRYLAGIPEGPLEIQRENALPMECNIDLSQGIDFRKGCYVGQELTIRTKHTGVVRKRILPVRLYTSDPPSDSSNDIDPNWPSERTPEIGADIKQLDENGSIKKGRAAGKFIGAISNIGLALCRLEMMTSIRVSAEGGSWKPGVEFGVQKESGDVVKVQAVVSQGFRKRERDVWDKARTRM